MWPDDTPIISVSLHISGIVFPCQLASLLILISMLYMFLENKWDISCVHFVAAIKKRLGKHKFYGLGLNRVQHTQLEKTGKLSREYAFTEMKNNFSLQINTEKSVSDLKKLKTKNTKAYMLVTNALDISSIDFVAANGVSVQLCKCFAEWCQSTSFGVKL